MDHDANIETFLKRCEDWHVRLNRDKIQLWLPEVPFIGHAATAQGVQVDPHKVQAILEMLPPVSKFMRHLSDVTKPLRELTQKEVVWTWGPAEKKGLETLKKAVTQTSVLRYYIQCSRGGDCTVWCITVWVRSSTSTEGPTSDLRILGSYRPRDTVCTNWERALVHSFRMWVFQVLPLWIRNHKCRNRSPASWVKAPP